ncbi:hypothetical protein Hdeb2414_s0071g00773721 [Helianthus debilis subsp. tardiflorus]
MYYSKQLGQSLLFVLLEFPTFTRALSYKNSQRNQCEYTRSHFRFKHIWVQHVFHIQNTQHLSLVLITLYPHLNMKQFDAC